MSVEGISDDSLPSAKKRKPNEGLDEELGEFEILTGFPSDLIVEGNGFTVKSHALVTWKSKSLKMIVQQPSNHIGCKKWILDKSITRKAVLCFLRWFYTNDTDYDELEPDDYDAYSTLLKQHFPDCKMQSKFSLYVSGKLGPILRNTGFLPAEGYGYNVLKKAMESMPVDKRVSTFSLFNYYVRHNIKMHFNLAKHLYMVMSNHYNKYLQNNFAAWEYVFIKLRGVKVCLLRGESTYLTYAVIAARNHSLSWADISKHIEGPVDITDRENGHIYASALKRLMKYLRKCNSEASLKLVKDMVLWFTA